MQDSWSALGCRAFNLDDPSAFATFALALILQLASCGCPREFVGLNLDLRSKYSPEFAQRIADPSVREAAIAEGVTETANDAANAHERCTESAQPAWGPA